MHPQPVPGNIGAAADPDIRVPADMVEEALQRGSARRTAGKAAMQPDRHHLRRLRPFLAQEVEGVGQVLGEAVIRGEAGRHHLLITDTSEIEQTNERIFLRIAETSIEITDGQIRLSVNGETTMTQLGQHQANVP